MRGEFNIADFEAKALDDYRSAKYKRAYKAATMEYHQNLSAGINRNKGRGVREIAEKYNKLELYSPKDRQLNKTVLHRVVV